MSRQVDRQALPEPNWGLKVPRSYIAPRNRLEMEVQLIWQAVLNKNEMISTDADFSELGGNMMHAVIANGIVRCVWGTTSHVSVPDATAFVVRVCVYMYAGVHACMFPLLCR